MVRGDLGPAQAQAQLSHAKLSTTEQHYSQRRTHGLDVRSTLDRYAKGSNGFGRSGRSHENVPDPFAPVKDVLMCARRDSNP